jgi:hypothetical protein
MAPEAVATETTPDHAVEYSSAKNSDGSAPVAKGMILESPGRPGLLLDINDRHEAGMGTEQLAVGMMLATLIEASCPADGATA